MSDSFMIGVISAQPNQEDAKRSAQFVQLAQASRVSAPDYSGSPSDPAVNGESAANTLGAISPISPAQITSLKSLVRKDIDMLDDMMLADQILMIRYMIELANNGQLMRTEKDENPVPSGALEAILAKYVRVANKAREIAGNQPQTKGHFRADSDYYFDKTFYQLDEASPKELVDRLLLLKVQLGEAAGQFPTDVNDADFEKKYSAALIKLLNDQNMLKYKDVLVKMMITVEMLVFRNMFDITMAGQLVRGWKEGESINASALQQISSARVAKKVKNYAAGGRLTKKAFSEASDEYGNLMYDLEEALKDVQLENGVIKISEDNLDFTGIPVQGLKEILNSSELSNKLKLLDSLGLSKDPVRPQLVLKTPNKQITLYDEQYALGLIALSKWLKGIEAMLNSHPVQAPAKFAFTVGEGDDVVDSIDDIAIILANRKRLYFLDRHKTELIVKNKDEYVETDKRKYLRICEEIISNPGSHKDLLKTARALYDHLIRRIMKNKEAYLRQYRSDILNIMSFETCLRAEIAGRRLSFAGAALAQAYAGKNNIHIEDSSFALLDDDSKILRGVPVDVMHSFLQQSVKRNFLKACEAMLLNPPQHKTLLDRAEQLYEIKRNEFRKVRLEVGKGFKETLKDEIAKGNLSFASFALAWAYAEAKGITIDNAYLEDACGQGKFLKEIPEELMGKFVDEYLPGEVK